MLKMAAFFISLLLSACNTTPVQLKDAKTISIDRVFAYQAKGEGKAILTVVRDKGFAGSACYSSFYINGVLAARVDVAEAAIFYV